MWLDVIKCDIGDLLIRNKFERVFAHVGRHRVGEKVLFVFPVKSIVVSEVEHAAGLGIFMLPGCRGRNRRLQFILQELPQPQLFCKVTIIERFITIVQDLLAAEER